MTFGTNYSVLLHAQLRGFYDAGAQTLLVPLGGLLKCVLQALPSGILASPPPLLPGGETGFTGVSKPRSYYKAPIAYIFILRQSASFCPYPRWKTTVAKTPHIWARHIRNHELSYIRTFIITNFHNYKALLLPAFVITKLLNNQRS